MRFSGQGGELFVIVLVGYLLSIITLGIYVFWFIPKLLQWGLSNLEIFAEGPAGQLSAGMSPGAPIGAGPGMGAMGPGRGYPGQPPMGQLGQAQPMGGPGQPMGGPGQPYGH
nr:DUF898 family protein [Pseudenhygromyxa sp. WMMC2535]